MPPYSTKSIVSLPSWVEQLQQADKVSSTAQAFARVPLVFRAVRLRCNSLVRVPVHFYRGRAEVEWPFAVRWRELLWRTEAAQLLAGAAYWLRLVNAYRLPKGPQWLNPFTMRVWYEQGERRFEQRLEGTRYPLDRPFWTEEDILYWSEFSPADDVGPGISPAAVALGDAQLMHSLAGFAGAFFENGAMPVTLLGLPATTPEPERERVENVLRRMLTGLRNAWRVLAVRAEIKPTLLTPPLRDLAIPELRHQAIDAVAWAFDIPRTMFMEDVANRATADNYFRQYITQTIVPRGELYQEVINSFLAPFGYTCRFCVDEMAEVQAEQGERAQAFAAYVRGGMAPQIAAAVLGIDIPREFESEWTTMTPPPSPAPKRSGGK